jgi:peptidoglycan/xylan/chitin deacetylase (PgdA/CDA1 family)
MICSTRNRSPFRDAYAWFWAGVSLLIAALGLVVDPLLAAAQSRASGVPVLVYHRFGPVVADSMTVTTKVFESQLAWLHDHDVQVIPLSLLIKSLEDPGIVLPARAAVITIDDGHRSVYEEALPIIRRERIPVTLFIYPSAISNAAYAMTWEQLAELRDTGLAEIQSHTYWHPNFHVEARRLAPADYQSFVAKQLTRSREKIASRLGGQVDMLAWPFGIHDQQLEQWAAEAGYVAAFTLERRGVAPGDNLMALPRFLMTDLDRDGRFAALIRSGEGEN